MKPSPLAAQAEVVLLREGEHLLEEDLLRVVVALLQVEVPLRAVVPHNSVFGASISNKVTTNQEEYYTCLGTG